MGDQESNGRRGVGISLVLVLVIIAICSGVLFGFRFGVRHNRLVPQVAKLPYSGAVPDEYVQGIASAIDSSDVRALRFEGHDIGLNDSAITVTDRNLIKRFLEALRVATWLPDLGVGPAQFQIHLRRRTADGKNVIELRFNPRIAESSFGPRFHNLLKELGALQARRFRDEIARAESNIREIDLPGRIIREPGEVRRIATALQGLDGRAFAFTESNPFHFSVSAVTDTGKAMHATMFVKEPPVPDVPVERRPLPQPLWEHYVETLGPDYERANRKKGWRFPL